MNYQIPEKGVGLGCAVSDGATIAAKLKNFEIEGTNLTISLDIGGLNEDDIDSAIADINFFLMSSLDIIMDVSFRRWKESNAEFLLFVEENEE